ncbi:MAG: GNAT family N-acetyltransferase [bacterium]|nr:GNAT family N-acetyltransferase [bacterium]
MTTNRYRAGSALVREESGMRIVEEQVGEALGAHATVPIAFEVTCRLRLELVDRGLHGIRLIREPVDPPYVKDYDQEEHPLRWQETWDTRNWGLISALDGTRRAGGAVIAWRTAGVNMLRGRDDLAVLWDIRVHPGYRRQGVGRRLFAAAVDWARARECADFLVETQNINVPACALYASMGCELAAISSFAYPRQPEEAQLLWRLRL